MITRTFLRETLPYLTMSGRDGWGMAWVAVDIHHHAHLSMSAAASCGVLRLGVLNCDPAENLIWPQYLDVDL